MRKLVIIGVGGFGREVAWLVERINAEQPLWDVLGFVDDNEALRGTTVNGYPVLGDTRWLREQDRDLHAVCAIGSSKTRKEVISQLDGVNFATLIDPSVYVSDRVRIGDGCIICAGAIVTVDIEIGSHVIVNLDCTIGHDAVVKDFVTLNPSVNVSGNTVLGECVEMGTGSQIIQGLNVADGTIVGAGAVLVKNVVESGTYVGVPGRRLPI